LSVISYGKPKLKGGSAIETVNVKTTLAQVCEVALTVEPLRVGPSFSQLSPREALHTFSGKTCYTIFHSIRHRSHIPYCRK